MSRNPHATNLRHFKPKRIEDKRECHREKFLAEAEREWRTWIDAAVFNA